MGFCLRHSVCVAHAKRSVSNSSRKSIAPPPSFRRHPFPPRLRRPLPSVSGRCWPSSSSPVALAGGEQEATAACGGGRAHPPPPPDLRDEKEAGGEEGALHLLRGARLPSSPLSSALSSWPSTNKVAAVACEIKVRSYVALASRRCSFTALNPSRRPRARPAPPTAKSISAGADSSSSSANLSSAAGA
jgi:hypothetical protein